MINFIVGYVILLAFTFKYRYYKIKGIVNFNRFEIKYVNNIFNQKLVNGSGRVNFIGIC